ncbi:MAG: MFS transporter [Acidobacteria bacterium]|nr:MFS transporter [Acidobacteriota bacterium]
MPGAVALPPSVSTGLLGWWRAASPDGRRALVAASLGWMLDMFDVNLYALVLASLMLDLGMAKSVGGLLGSITLVASAVGGIAFGVIADRYGRTRALMASILIYSTFTGACGLAQTIGQLAVLRILVGLGMGGEWASGAALVSEIWPAEHRGKALAFMQSTAAIGYICAPIVVALIMPTWGWRAVFFVGVLPALLTFWIRRGVKESRMWEASRAHPDSHGSFWDIFGGELRRPTIALTLMHAFTSFAWWGFNFWVPAYLTLPVEQGGIGLSAYAMAGLLVAMQTGMWFGYVSFGYASDRFGRKSTYVTYLVVAAVLVFAYASTRNPLVLLILGPPTAFFGTGHISGFGAVTAEIYPTSIRGRAQGFTYNIARLVSAGAPFAVGSLAQTYGFEAALSINALAFLLGAVMWVGIPETKGRVLE